jgi:hypothetical protein
MNTNIEQLSDHFVTVGNNYNYIDYEYIEDYTKAVIIETLKLIELSHKLEDDTFDKIHSDTVLYHFGIKHD